MRISKLRSGNISLTYLDPVEVDAFFSIPHHAHGDGIPEAEQRLFPPPVLGDGAEGLQADWDEYVVPDLKQHFADGLEKVRDDLSKIQPQISGQGKPAPRKKADKKALPQGMDPLIKAALEVFMAKLEQVGNEQIQEDEEEEIEVPWQKLVIPRDHIDSWYRAMNQARLVMCEKELWVEDGGRIHGPLRWQLHYEIYSSFQWWLVDHAMGKPG